MSPNFQPEPPLTQLEAIPSCPRCRCPDVHRCSCEGIFAHVQLEADVKLVASAQAFYHFLKVLQKCTIAILLKK